MGLWKDNEGINLTDNDLTVSELGNTLDQTLGESRPASPTIPELTSPALSEETVYPTGTWRNTMMTHRTGECSTPTPAMLGITQHQLQKIIQYLSGGTWKAKIKKLKYISRRIKQTTRIASTTAGLFQCCRMGRRPWRRKNSVHHKPVKLRGRQMDNTLYWRTTTINMGKLSRIRQRTLKPVGRHRRQGRSEHNTEDQARTEIDYRILERIQTSG